MIVLSNNIYVSLSMHRSNNAHKAHDLTTISVSYGNYLALKELGCAGDSFNDVLTELLKLKNSVDSERRIRSNRNRQVMLESGSIRLATTKNRSIPITDSKTALESDSGHD